jgi:hypothetical protein
MRKEYCKSFELPTDTIDYLEFINNKCNIITRKKIAVYPQEAGVLILAHYYIDEYAPSRDYIKKCIIYYVPGGEHLYNKLIDNDLIKITDDIVQESKKEVIMVGFVEFEDYSRKEVD